MAIGLQGDAVMKRQMAAFMMCGVIAVLASACATKGFVREQAASTEAKLSQRADKQEAGLRDASDRTAANTQALEAAGRHLQGLDVRLGEVAAVAGDAKKGAETAAEGLRETSQRFANRNKYAPLETRSIYFAFAKAELQDEGINELDDVAKALQADPNAVVELQGFADPRGTAMYNFRLTRDRVDAVIRHLVQRGVDLRRIHAVGMGKVTLAANEANKDGFAKSRRVDIRLLAPQS
jgi:outer membrane protein OmpA-like peptidoglycan-associated protein